VKLYCKHIAVIHLLVLICLRTSVVANSGLQSHRNNMDMMIMSIAGMGWGLGEKVGGQGGEAPCRRRGFCV